MACQHCICDTKANEMCVLNVPIFNQLSLQELEEIAKVSVQKSYRKKELIFRAGEPSEQLFIIHKGRVKIYRLSVTGKEQLIRILEAGDFMGELALFSQAESSCYAEALEETEVCLFYKKDIQELIVKYPSISLKLLEELSDRLNETEKLFEEVNVEDVEQRTASYLINLAANQGTRFSSEPIKITLPVSKQDLASYIGTSRETLSRKLSTFQRKGWIRQSGQRTITILKYNRLRNEAGE